MTEFEQTKPQGLNPWCILIRCSTRMAFTSFKARQQSLVSFVVRYCSDSNDLHNKRYSECHCDRLSEEVREAQLSDVSALLLFGSKPRFFHSSCAIRPFSIRQERYALASCLHCSLFFPGGLWTFRHRR